MRTTVSTRPGPRWIRLRAQLVLVILTIVGTACTSIVGLNLSGSTTEKNHDGTMHLSMLAPLTREQVGLAPIEETESDSYWFSSDRQDPIDVQLELPDGAMFVEQARLIRGYIFRTEPRAGLFSTRGMPQSLDEAVQDMLARADRFGYDEETIKEWQADVVDHFASDKQLHHTRYLNLDPVGHLRPSVQLRSMPADETVIIFWSFSWHDIPLT